MNYAKILGSYLMAASLIGLATTVFETNWTVIINTLSVTAPSSSPLFLQVLLFPYYVVSLVCIDIANAFLSNFGTGINYLFSFVLPALIVLTIGIFILKRYGKGKS